MINTLLQFENHKNKIKRKDINSSTTGAEATKATTRTPEFVIKNSFDADDNNDDEDNYDNDQQK